MARRSPAKQGVPLVTATNVGLSLRACVTATISGGVTIVVAREVVCRPINGARVNGHPDLAETCRNDAPSRTSRTGGDANTVCPYTLVFVSPEWVVTRAFAESVRPFPVRTVILDNTAPEDVGQRGIEMDDSWRGRLRALFPESTVLTLAALAPPLNGGGGSERLTLHDKALVAGDVERRNVTLSVEPRSDSLNSQLLEHVHRRWGKAGIVYCPRLSAVDELTRLLQRTGIPAAPFYGNHSVGRPGADVDRFNGGRADVVVAVTGEGQGIDRPDINYVVHAAMPRSLGVYARDIRLAAMGRACSDCIILYSRDDVRGWASLLKPNGHTNHFDTQINQLHAIDAYCRTELCRHGQLISHFTHHYDIPSPSEFSCHHCDVCLQGPRRSAGTAVRPHLARP